MTLGCQPYLKKDSLFIEGSRTLALAKARDMGLQEVINQMKADYINEVRARKHDMKTPMTQLRNTLTLIKELVGEIPEEYAYRLNKYVERQQKAMNVLSDIVTHIADEDKFATPEIVDIESVLKSFETTTDRYVIEYHRDNASLLEAGIETPHLRIGKVDFVRLSQNIISNAIRRGFVKDNADYAKPLNGILICQSFYSIFEKLYAEAEAYSKEALEVDSTNHIAYSNLAAALLFQGKYQEAEKIYLQYKPEQKEGFLSDFEEFSKAGVIPKSREEDVEKIKKILKEE